MLISFFKLLLIYDKVRLTDKLTDRQWSIQCQCFSSECPVGRGRWAYVYAIARGVLAGR